jgi:hypothetical protein
MPIPALALGLGGMSLLGGLFGGKKGGLDAKTLERLFGAGAISQDTMKLYQMLSQSPQFRQLLLQNSIQGSQFQNQLSGNLAQRGLSTSGIGSIANAAGQSAIQTGETSLRGGLFGEAMDTAMKSLMARLQAYSGGQQIGMQQPSSLQSFFGNTLGAVGQSLPYFATKQGT